MHGAELPERLARPLLDASCTDTHMAVCTLDTFSSAVSVLSVSSIYSHMSAAVSQTTDQTCQLDVAPFEGSKMVS